MKKTLPVGREREKEERYLAAFSLLLHFLPRWKLEKYISIWTNRLFILSFNEVENEQLTEHKSNTGN